MCNGQPAIAKKCSGLMGIVGRAGKQCQAWDHAVKKIWTPAPKITERLFLNFFLKHGDRETQRNTKGIRFP